MDIASPPLKRLKEHLKRHLKDLYINDECMTGTRIRICPTDEMEQVEGVVIEDSTIRKWLERALSLLFYLIHVTLNTVRTSRV